MYLQIASLLVLAVAAQAQIPIGWNGINGLGVIPSAYGRIGPNVAADYAWSSVDVNPMDGQPDRPMIAAAPMMSYAAPMMAPIAAAAPVMSYAAAPVAAPVMSRITTPIAGAPIMAPIAPAPVVQRVVPVAPAVTSTQYHSQDELGQASFGYAHPGQAATNFRDAMGNQVGSYSYINPAGKMVQVSYVADSLGFRVLSNDLPVGPVAELLMPIDLNMPAVETAEVAEARAAHMAAIEDAKNGVVRSMPVDLPKQVEDTAEVAAAKAEHAVAVAEAKAAADAAPAEDASTDAAAPAERKKRQIALPFGLSTLAAAPIAPLGIRSAVAPYAAGHAVREAELLRVVNNPGHAVSYRVY